MNDKRKEVLIINTLHENILAAIIVSLLVSLPQSVIHASGNTQYQFDISQFENHTGYRLQREGAATADEQYYLTLIHALIHRQTDEVRHLLSQRPEFANGLPIDPDGYPLDITVANEDAASFELLLETGATLLADPAYGNALLYGLALKGNFAMATRLVMRFPDIEVNNESERFGNITQVSEPLYRTAGKGNVEFAKILLDKGASVEGDKLFNHPITAAAIGEHVEIVKLLLEAGSTANPAEEGTTLTDILKESGHTKALPLLLEHVQRSK